MKLKSNEKVLETKLNFEPYGEERPIKDPIEEIIETTESMRDIEEKIFAHIQELEEKYPDYVNFRYDKQIKEEGKGFSAWFDLIGVTSAPVEEEEVKATITMTVPKGLGKTGSVAGGMGIGSKSPLAYSSPKTKTRIDATGKVPVWTQKDGTKIEIDKIDKVIIGSVVPQLTKVVASSIKKIHNKIPIIVDRNTPSGVIPKSKQMGTDIYANLVAAHNLYPRNKKIILDFGTALTASCLTENGETVGVIIAPGIVTSLNSLIKGTAQLPEIELVKPKSVLGLDTITCMQSGMVYGFLGMVEGFIDRINDEVNDNCFVIATGGVSHVYKPLTNKINIADKLHTLKGLYYLGKDL